MGLMDQFKDAAEQAQQAAQQAAGMAPDAADVEYAQLVNKLNTSGLPGTATVKSIAETGKTDVGGSKQFAIEVAVELEDGESYDTTVNQYLVEQAVDSYREGAKFEAKADPDDHSKVILYGIV